MSAMLPGMHRAHSSLHGATDLEHRQLALFAGPGVERNSLVDRKSEKCGADRGQDGHAPARNVGIKRINQDDFLDLSGLFVPKFDLAAQIDDVRTQFFRRQDVRAVELLTEILTYFRHWPACE